MSSKPWYSKGLRFECQRTGNCCTSHGEYAYVYLAAGDVAAMSAELGLTEPAFLERYCAKDDSYTILRMDAPRCPFLTEENTCAVYRARPKQCATWPFWHENLEQARWEGPIRERCEGIGKGRLHPPEEIERIVRETEDWYGAADAAAAAAAEEEDEDNETGEE